MPITTVPVYSAHLTQNQIRVGTFHEKEQTNLVANLRKKYKVPQLQRRQHQLLLGPSSSIRSPVRTDLGKRKLELSLLTQRTTSSIKKL